MIKIKKTSINIVALYSICCFNILIMHIYIKKTCNTELEVSWTSWIDNFYGIVFDVTILSLVSLFIVSRKLRTNIMLTYILTFGWSFCNIIYSRFFHSYISLSAIKQVGLLFDPIVLNSTIYGFYWQDAFFLISPLLFLFFFYHTPKIMLTKKTTILQLIIISVFLLLPLTAHAIECLVNSNYRYLTYYINRIQSRYIDKHLATCAPIYTTFTRGSIRMLGIELFDEIEGTEELTTEQIIKIEHYIKESKKSLVGIRTDNKMQKNIIFIIVESYMSFTSDLFVKGKEITPYLNALKHDSTVYYNGHVQSNITLGESSDGQFIYMTGLLPLRSAITISKIRNNKLPSLPKVLAQKGLRSIMIIPTHPSFWDQDKMCQQYGFDKLYSSNDFNGEHEISLNDQQVFQLASNKNIYSMQQEKCFAVILTMSMHQPYTSPIDSTISFEDSSLSNELSNYLNACHYTDSIIGNYIQHLKRTKMYDNSIIIITSDHHIHSTDFGSTTPIPKELPLYIINSNINTKTAWHGKCNQIDIYTTLLDLIGIKNDFCGLGHSLLNSSYKNSMDMEKWNVSEWMLKSNYFK